MITHALNSCCIHLPRKKFNKEAANRLWADYSKKLVASITETEKEGVDKGFSSYEIEKLWQERVKENAKSATNH